MPYFCRKLNTTDNEVLIDQIMKAVDAVKRPIRLAIDEFDFETVLITDSDRVDGPKVPTFRDELVKELVRMGYTLSSHCDPQLHPLTEDLADCKSVYIIRHGNTLTVRGHSSEYAFRSPWGSHVDAMRAIRNAKLDLEHFDQTGLIYREAAA